MTCLTLNIRTSISAILTVAVMMLLTMDVQCWRFQTSPLYRSEITDNEAKFNTKVFISPGQDHLRILEIDEVNKAVIVGGKNAMYNISLENLPSSGVAEINQKLEWDANQQAVCLAKGKTEMECQNYIRVMAIRDDGKVYVCGTNAYKPKCRTYDRTADGMIALTKYTDSAGVAIAPVGPNQNNSFTYAHGKMYTGTVTDFSGRKPLFYSGKLRTSEDAQSLDHPNFVGSFKYGDLVYFFFREVAVEYSSCGKAIYSRVARVCNGDKGGAQLMSNEFTSFFKSRLNCSVVANGEPFYFNEIQAMTPLGYGNALPTRSKTNRTEMIYGIFNTPKNSISGSAVCAFRLADISDSFTRSFVKMESGTRGWSPVSFNQIPVPHPAKCRNDTKAINVLTLNFIKDHPIMAQAVPSYANKPQFIYTSLTSTLTSVAVDWQRPTISGVFYDVLFMGTDNGKVLKSINRDSGSEVDSFVIEEITVFARSVQITSLHVVRSSARNAYLQVASRYEIKFIPLDRCHLQTTCHDCVRLQDPYCSWTSNKCASNLVLGKQDLLSGLGCPGPAPTRAKDSDSTPISSSAPPVPPCECPEQSAAQPKPTVDSQRVAGTTPTDSKNANRIEDPYSSHQNDLNSIPNVVQPRKEPEVGAATQARGDMVSAFTLAISLIFSILIAVIVGFVAGYRTSMYRNKGHTEHTLFMRSPKADPLKNLNRFDDSNRYNSHDYMPQPQSVKQLNVVFNPLKPNSKLPNGSAQTEVQKQKPKKVYL